MSREKKKPTRLGNMLRLWRTVNNWTLRDVAPGIGIGHATLMRIEAGEAFDAATMLKLWTWLLTAPDEGKASPARVQSDDPAQGDGSAPKTSSPLSLLSQDLGKL